MASERRTWLLTEIQKLYLADTDRSMPQSFNYRQYATEASDGLERCHEDFRILFL
jgi:hypothetical protein